MRNVRGDWVVLNGKTGRFECGRCGESYKPNLPVHLSMYTSMAKEFLKFHSMCKPKVTA